MVESNPRPSMLHTLCKILSQYQEVGGIYGSLHSNATVCMNSVPTGHVRDLVQHGGGEVHTLHKLQVDVRVEGDLTSSLQLLLLGGAVMSRQETLRVGEIIQDKYISNIALQYKYKCMYTCVS